LRQLFIPVPGDEHGAVTRAPRLKTLAGVKIGLLGNLKPNCDVLLHTTGNLFLERGAGETMFREKASCSLGADVEMLDGMAAACRAAVVALGD
jgi:hypothetical protein